MPSGICALSPSCVMCRRYDPVALLCCLPSTRHFFNPTVKRVHGVEHLVIGRSKEEPGIRLEQIDELTDFLYTSFFKGVTMNFSEFVNTKAIANTSEELTVRRNRVRKASEVRRGNLTLPISSGVVRSTKVSPLPSLDSSRSSS